MKLLKISKTNNQSHALLLVRTVVIFLLLPWGADNNAGNYTGTPAKPATLATPSETAKTAKKTKPGEQTQHGESRQYHLPGETNEQTTTAELDENSTLPDILAYAALHNPDLEAAFYRWQAALERIPLARSLPDPAVNFAYFIQEVETRVGPQRGKVGIMQMLPWFDKPALRGSAAAAGAKAELYRFDSMKRDLFARVKIAYYDLYFAERRIALLKENLGLLEDREKVLEVTYTTGKTPYTALLKLQVEVAQLQNQLVSAEASLRPLSARLNGILNRPPSAPLPTPQPANLPTVEILNTLVGAVNQAEENPVNNSSTPGTPAAASAASTTSTPTTISTAVLYERLAERLKENNPVLKTLDAFAKQEKTGLRLAKRNYLPDFSVGLDYIITSPSMMPGIAESGKDPFLVMLSLQLPLWFHKNKAAVSAADYAYRAALSKRQEEENKLLTRLEMLLFTITDADRKIHLYNQKLIPQARQAFEVTRSAFETGSADYLEFVEAQRTLLAFELELEAARTELARGLAELEMLI